MDGRMNEGRKEARKQGSKEARKQEARKQESEEARKQVPEEGSSAELLYKTKHTLFLPFHISFYISIVIKFFG